jgi:hypothetical protein
MNEKLDAELCAKYPKMFAERNLPMTETCMCWGFTHGDGWFNIIDALCANIQSHIDYSVKRNKADSDYNMMLVEVQQGNLTRFNEYFKGYSEHSLEERKQTMLASDFRDVTPIVEQVVVEQVKEKFGSLRFYYQGGDDEISGMVRMAESMSNRTCEECGAPGKSREGGWIRTLCDTHAAAKEQDYVI